jgi:hypothetical protein
MDESTITAGRHDRRNYVVGSHRFQANITGIIQGVSAVIASANVIVTERLVFVNELGDTINFEATDEVEASVTSQFSTLNAGRVLEVRIWLFCLQEDY